jgi:hypothetical protein
MHACSNDEKDIYIHKIHRHADRQADSRQAVGSYVAFNLIQFDSI